jgi:hypothetical protein
MIRYHSFYPYVILPPLSLTGTTSADSRMNRWHRENAYQHLTNANDQKALMAVRAFNPYDLYSKSDEPVEPEKLRPYYQRLISQFFPEVIEW